MANSSNVSLRSVLARPLLYEEVDTNFQELIFVIDDFNAHVISTTAHDAIDLVFDPSTSELVSTNIQEAIVEHVDSATAHDAADLVFNNTYSSGHYAATNVQTALEEIETNLDAHNDSNTAHDAVDIVFDPSTSELSSINVQTAIVEHVDSATAHDAVDLVFDPSTSNLLSTDLQTATEEVQANLEAHESASDPHTMYARKDANLSDLVDPDAARETLSAVEKTSNTGAAVVPTGTEAQRDGSPSAGYLRFNSDIGLFEGYNGTEWVPVGSGATGAAGDQVFVENDQTVTADYTIPSDKNAMTTGPITIDDGVTVTVSDGARWVVI